MLTRFRFGYALVSSIELLLERLRGHFQRKCGDFRQPVRYAACDYVSLPRMLARALPGPPGATRRAPGLRQTQDTGQAGVRPRSFSLVGGLSIVDRPLRFSALAPTRIPAGMQSPTCHPRRIKVYRCTAEEVGCHRNLGPCSIGLFYDHLVLSVHPVSGVRGVKGERAQIRLRTLDALRCRSRPG